MQPLSRPFSNLLKCPLVQPSAVLQRRKLWTNPTGEVGEGPRSTTAAPDFHSPAGNRVFYVAMERISQSFLWFWPNAALWRPTGAEPSNCRSEFVIWMFSSEAQIVRSNFCSVSLGQKPPLQLCPWLHPAARCGKKNSTGENEICRKTR